jgi:hypothetical protein
VEAYFVNMVDAWLLDAAGQWRLNLVSSQSAWINNIFNVTPKWIHLPFLVLFGLLQPFLPAALVEPGAGIWRAIAIYRSLGWFLALPFLMYTSLAVVKRWKERRVLTFLVAAFWIVALIASYRTPGYLWDNPRYRTAYVAIQAVLMAWAWYNARSTGNRWLQRAGIALGGTTLIFLHWYAGRYLGTPKLSLWATLGVIGGFLVAYIVGMAYRDRHRLAD